MRIEEIMTTPIVFTQPEIKISNLKDMFARKKISAVPVLEKDGEISGVISSNDLIAVNDQSTLVKDVMTHRVHVCLKSGRVKDAAKVMAKNNIHHLIVMDDGNIVGMISSINIVKLYSEE